MGAEYTPVFLVPDRGDRDRREHDDRAAPCLAPSKTTRVKQMPYESGMDPIGDARQRFDVRFYLVAIVFLLFDVELLFLYPWAVAQWSADPSVWRRRDRRCRSAGIPAEFRGLGLLGDHGVHRDPGRGVRLCLAERGLRMAVGTRTRRRSRPGSTPPSGSTLALKPADALEMPENMFMSRRSTRSSTGAASTASGRCRSPRPAAASS